VTAVIARYPQDRASGLPGNLREGTVVDVLAALQKADRVDFADREVRTHQNVVWADPFDQRASVTGS
jgi:hypothetical protein